MLLQLAIGDAYALAWEFAPGQTAPNDLAGYHQNPKHAELKPGRYSDDTMRALANAAVVLTGSSAWFDPAAYVAAYQKAYNADPRAGWSRSFQAHLKRHHDATPVAFMKALRRRPTNGAVMGVAPLGYLPDEPSVRLASSVQCIATHHGAACSAAQAVALAAHYLIYRKGPRADLIAYLRDEVDWESAEEASRILGPDSPVPRADMPAWTIAAGALFVLTDDSFTGLSDRLTWIVDQGRQGPADTDSLAAVTMALASCATDIAQDLPVALIYGLEDEIARGNLVALDRRLTQLAISQQIIP
jgi:hypothetical protein